MRYTGVMTRCPWGPRCPPRGDPNWDHQGDLGLIVGLLKAGHKAINFDKLRLITQGLDENLAQFLKRVTETLQNYTRFDPTSAERTIVLNTHFISQSSPDILKKLKKAEGPRTPQRDLLNLVFKIFNNWEEQAKLEKSQ